MKLPRKFSQSARKTFFVIHLWTGLILGLWLVMIGLTGSVLAWRSEFTGWEARQRVGATKPRAGEAIIPASRALAAFKAADPKLKPERGFYLPPGEYGYYLLNARGEINGKRTSLIYMVNPVTGQAYPPVDRSTLWVETFEHLHAELIAGARGNIANGVLSFFALFLLASGAWLWWPSNWKQLKNRLTIKRGTTLRRTLYDWHNVLGVYLFGLLFVLTLTGVLLVWNGQTEQSLTKFVDARTGARKAAVQGSETVSGGQMPDIVPRGKMLGVDELVARAKAAVPGATLLFISLPDSPEKPFQTAFDPIGFNNGLVLFDPYTGERLAANGSTFSTGEMTMKVAGDLHYGWFGGVWSKFFYSLSGLMPLGLFVTGLMMWWKRLSAKKQAAKRRAQNASATSATINAEV